MPFFSTTLLRVACPLQHCLMPHKLGLDKSYIINACKTILRLYVHQFWNCGVVHVYLRLLVRLDIWDASFKLRKDHCFGYFDFILVTLLRHECFVYFIRRGEILWVQ